MKTLILDIETAPLTVHAWGLWKQNVGINQIVQDTYVLNWSAKWVEDEYIYTDALCYHDEYKDDPTNDRHILENLVELMEQADVVVAHNGDRFDIPTINNRLLYHGINPPSTYKTVDTLKIAKRRFRLTSNKLEFLARHLGVGSKIDTGGFELWADIVHKKCRKAWKHMIEYCEHDTMLLEAVYLRLRPWDNQHPTMVFSTDLSKPNRSS